MAVRRIRKQLTQAEDRPIEGVHLATNGENLFELKGWIVGPECTVYEGGLFQLQLKLPQDFPFKPPKVTFKTKIYHPNINQKGGISCCNIYCGSCGCSNWSPAQTILFLLDQIRTILISPSPDDPLVPDIALQYKNKRDEFDKIAREWVQKYT